MIATTNTKPKLFKWTEGRQAGRTNGELGLKYKKYCFLWWKIGRFGFDGYILKYPAKIEVNNHKDPIPNGRHYRINLTLKGKSIFFTQYPTIFSIGQRLHIFRPDINFHRVATFTPVTKLSLGIAKFNKS